MGGDRRGLPWRAASALRRFPAAYWLARRGYGAINGLRAPVVIDGIPGRVHRNDLMIDSTEWSRRTYVTAALDAVDRVRVALEAAGRPLADSDVLDFGCGHGQVVRHLAKTARSVTACDLDHEGVRFCASEFGAIPLRGHRDIHEVALGDYDAIWLGSVITHHPPDVCRDLLTTLAQHVRPGGVLVASNQDEATLSGFVEPSATATAWLRPMADHVSTELAANGAAYVDYPQNQGGSYGLGFQTAAWLDGVLAGAGLARLPLDEATWVVQRTHAWHRPTTDGPAG